MTEVKKNPNQVSAYLDEWTMSQVQAYATKNDRSISWVVGFAMKQFFVAAGDAREPFRDGAAKHGQMDIETAIAAAVKCGPVKAAKHK